MFRNSAPVWWLGNDVRHERHSYGDQRCRGDLKPSRLEITSGVHWPVTVDSGVTTIGNSGDGHIQTVVTIDSSGTLTAMTHIWDTNGWGFLSGFHKTVVTLFDGKGNQLDQWAGGPWGVEGGQSSQSTWTEHLNAEDLLCRCLFRSSTSTIRNTAHQVRSPPGFSQTGTRSPPWQRASPPWCRVGAVWIDLRPTNAADPVIYHAPGPKLFKADQQWIRAFAASIGDAYRFDRMA